MARSRNKKKRVRLLRKHALMRRLKRLKAAAAAE